MTPLHFPLRAWDLKTRRPGAFARLTLSTFPLRAWDLIILDQDARGLPLSTFPCGRGAQDALEQDARGLSSRWPCSVSLNAALPSAFSSHAALPSAFSRCIFPFPFHLRMFPFHFRIFPFHLRVCPFHLHFVRPYTRLTEPPAATFCHKNYVIRPQNVYTHTKQRSSAFCIVAAARGLKRSFPAEIEAAIRTQTVKFA